MAFSLEVPDENEVKAIVRQQVEPTEERRRTIAGANPLPSKFWLV